jgi:alanine racemase
MTPPEPQSSVTAAGARRGAWLEIDLASLRHNVGVIRRVVGASVAVAPVVKADAYGHGSVAVAPALADVSDALCVATLDEALALRVHGVKGRIIVLYAVPLDGVADARAQAIELTLMSAQHLHSVRDQTADDSRTLGLHLAVETGFSRGGLTVADLVAVAAEVQADPHTVLMGIWSHLASASDAEPSRLQAHRFEEAISALVSSGASSPQRHLAASEGIFAATVPSYDLVRPGLAVYGVLDGAMVIAPHTEEEALALRPAMALKARAAAFSDVPSGGAVGYGGHWQASRPSRVAILPLGYGDGYARSSQPGAEVLVRGQRVPLVGVISMDAVAVDVTDIPAVGYEDEFVLLGTQGGQSVSAGELARQRNTIAWEVLCGMAARLERVYNRSADGAQPG